MNVIEFKIVAKYKVLQDGWLSGVTFREEGSIGICSNKVYNFWLLSNCMVIKLPCLPNLFFPTALILKMIVVAATSVPSKALCRKIGSALLKIGSTDFLKMCKKVAFSYQISFFSVKHTIFDSKTLLTFCQIGPSWKPLEGTLAATLW